MSVSSVFRGKVAASLNAHAYLHMMFDYEQYLSCDRFSTLLLQFANKWGKVPAVYVIQIHLRFLVFVLSLLELFLSSSSSSHYPTASREHCPHHLSKKYNGKDG